jgi:pantoate--beta-alanine ligase
MSEAVHNVSPLPAKRPGALRILRDVATLREATKAWRRAGKSVGVVPTMGGLHDGHLTLVRHALADNDHVVVTVFVNPKQFDRPEDLASYPRNEERDAALLRDLGVDILFAPPVEEMYPGGFETTVSVGGLTDVLDGVHRPGHFDGVTTVVTKLLLQSGADRAYFGEKDFQQLRVVQRLVADLNIDVEIAPVETVRAEDGLALASRNVYLSAEERAVAPQLHALMSEIAEELRHGAKATPLLESGVRRLVQAGFSRVDYLELHDARTLEALETASRPGRLFAAAWLGEVRLIDNIPV